MYSYRYKLKVANFYRESGLKATLKQFKVKSKSSILAWSKIVKKAEEIDISGKTTTKSEVEKLKKLQQEILKELHNKPTTPNKFYLRENNWNPVIYDLIRSIRYDHPSLCKEKIYVRILRKLAFKYELEITSCPTKVSKITQKILNLNQEWLNSLDLFERKHILKVKPIKIPSISTIGRILADLKNKKLNCGGLVKDPKSESFFANTSSFRIHPSKNKRKSKVNRTPTMKNAKAKGLKTDQIKTKAIQFKPGERLQQDTIELRLRGKTIYLFGLIDLRSRLSFYVSSASWICSS